LLKHYASRRRFWQRREQRVHLHLRFVEASGFIRNIRADPRSLVEGDIGHAIGTSHGFQSAIRIPKSEIPAPPPCFQSAFRIWEGPKQDAHLSLGFTIISAEEQRGGQQYLPSYF